MKANFTTISLTTLTAFLVVWVALVSFDWVEEYLASRQSPAYDELPFEFKLKAKPEEVIYSEAYTTVDGREIVKYAYLVGEVGPQLNEDLTRRTPNSYTEVVEKYEDEEGRPMEKLKTTFLSKPSFYEKDGKWKQIEYATTTPEVFAMSGAIPYVKRRELAERIIPGRSAFATVSTFYPQPNVETVSVDGHVIATGGVWATVRGAAAGTSVVDSGTTQAALSNTFMQVDIYRVFLLFDTASLPDADTILSATLSVYATAIQNGDNDGDDTINVVTSNPASNTGLVIGDFDQLGTTLQAPAIDITSITTSAYNVFTLNSTGLGNISKTGVTKFGLREGHDLIDSATTLISSMTCSSADNTGTSQDPKLDVTHEASVFSFGMWFPF
jgi:hypothetical protein